MTNDSIGEEIQAFACHGPHQPVVPFTYKPRPLDANMLDIRITHCGICGSDIHTLDSGWGPTKYPVVVGHEIVGEVIQGGEEALRQFPIGSRVGVGAQVWSCGECRDCDHDRMPHCTKGVFTYNGKYADGEPSYGGYAKRVRVDARFAVKIPEALSSDVAAPLMCAGVTVFAPMRRYGVKAGDRVGVVGIGGLGHLAVQFAKALGCTVTAISSKADKAKDSAALGAQEYLSLSDDAAFQQRVRSLDFLFITSNSVNQPWQKYFGLLDVDGSLIMLAAPEKPLTFSAFGLISKNLRLCGSLIGSPNDLQDTLNFSAEHSIAPWIETLPMENVMDGLQRVRDGTVRYRVVLSNL